MPTLTRVLAMCVFIFPSAAARRRKLSQEGDDEPRAFQTIGLSDPQGGSQLESREQPINFTDAGSIKRFFGAPGESNRDRLPMYFEAYFKFKGYAPKFASVQNEVAISSLTEIFSELKRAGWQGRTSLNRAYCKYRRNYYSVAGKPEITEQSFINVNEAIRTFRALQEDMRSYFREYWDGTYPKPFEKIKQDPVITALVSCRVQHGEGPGGAMENIHKIYRKAAAQPRKEWKTRKQFSFKDNQGAAEALEAVGGRVVTYFRNYIESLDQEPGSLKSLMGTPLVTAVVQQYPDVAMKTLFGSYYTAKHLHFKKLRSTGTAILKISERLNKQFPNADALSTLPLVQLD